jgi:hypothetical protein
MRAASVTKADAKPRLARGVRAAPSISKNSEKDAPSLSQQNPSNTPAPIPASQVRSAPTRGERAGKIIDEILDGRADDEKSQARVALEILKMEKPQDDGPKAFGSVVIQGKLSLEEWNEMRERMRSLGK